MLNAFRTRILAAVLAAACACVCLGAASASAQQRGKTPQQLTYHGYVNDFADVLNVETKQKLTELCTEVDQKAHAQIAVVTVTSLDGESVEQFTVDLAMGWGIGPKKNNRGALVLLAPSERKYRIEVGYGLEPILPDGKVGEIGREAVPLLRSSDYSGAVMLMTRRVAEVIAADKQVTLTSLTDIPNPPAPRSLGSGRNGQSMIGVFVVLFIVFGMLAPFILSIIFGRRRGLRGRGRSWGGGPGIFWGGGGWGGGFGGGGLAGEAVVAGVEAEDLAVSAGVRSEAAAQAGAGREIGIEEIKKESREWRKSLHNSSSN